jgi:hypothetical protein
MAETFLINGFSNSIAITLHNIDIA